jgi:exodeoxyribonuclease III
MMGAAASSGTTSSMVIASWNVNSIRARLEHVKTWLTTNHPDVLLLQELKATEFPAELFEELGYRSAAVTQKAYNGVAILSRHPIDIVSTTLIGDETDSHARFLEVVITAFVLPTSICPTEIPSLATSSFTNCSGWIASMIRCRFGQKARCQCSSVVTST